MGKASQARKKQRADDIEFLITDAKKNGFPEHENEASLRLEYRDMPTAELHRLRIQAETQFRIPSWLQRGPGWRNEPGASNLLRLVG